MRIDKTLLEKSLLLAADLFAATDSCRRLLGDERFMAEFLPHLQRIQSNLAQGPNPDLAMPLLDALAWGFHSPLQPTLESIIYAQRFDWRFVTGRRRPFKALAPGAPVPRTVAELWQIALHQANQALSRVTIS
ncbi:MAG: hypothetical protein HQM04_11795 [Magnetococcales bacterium]|nr:hypothetical protein [Magnetococcales bacterium]MBF0115708.1 hypothetical protein [Magnetococcales bacterium]